MEKFDLEDRKDLKQAPFQVPDRYFSDLGMRVQAHVASRHKPAPTIYWTWALRLALPAVVLAVGLWWMQQKPSPAVASHAPAPEALISGVSEEAIQLYLIENASEEEIYEVALGNETLSDTEELLLEEIEVEDLENYL